MKVLKDNYKTTTCAEPMNHSIVCERCASELEYSDLDIENGAYGCALVKCPLCGYENFLDDEIHDIDLTVNNVEFPIHFNHTSTETGAVDCLNNEQIRECIRKAIDYFRKYKDEQYWFTSFGNLHISVSRWDGDESYDVVVTGDYYNTFIPFEDEDY